MGQHTGLTQTSSLYRPSGGGQGVEGARAQVFSPMTQTSGLGLGFAEGLQGAGGPALGRLGQELDQGTGLTQSSSLYRPRVGCRGFRGSGFKKKKLQYTTTGPRLQACGWVLMEGCRGHGAHVGGGQAKTWGKAQGWHRAQVYKGPSLDAGGTGAQGHLGEKKGYRIAETVQ